METEDKAAEADAAAAKPKLTEEETKLNDKVNFDKAAAKPKLTVTKLENYSLPKN